MNALVEQTSFGVTTSSRTVAEVFVKEHLHVLRDIDVILKRRPDLCGTKFGLTSVDVPMPKGGVRQVRAFEMNRDGFILLAMGFTGEEALDWKLSFLEAFNRMEEELARGEPRPTPRAEIVLPPLNELVRRMAVAEGYRRSFGPDAGRWMIALLGLPIPPGATMLVEPDGLRVVADNVTDWSRDCCEVDGAAVELAGDLYRSYQDWCAEKQKVPETQRGFGTTLSRLGVALAARDRRGLVRRQGLKLVT